MNNLTNNLIELLKFLIRKNVFENFTLKYFMNPTVTQIDRYFLKNNIIVYNNELKAHNNVIILLNIVLFNNKIL